MKWPRCVGIRRFASGLHRDLGQWIPLVYANLIFHFHSQYVLDLGSFPLGTFIFIVGSSEIRTYERLSSLLPDRPSSVKSNQQLRVRRRALVTCVLLSVWVEIEDRWQVVEISRSSSMQSYDLRTLASRRTRASDIPISTRPFPFSRASSPSSYSILILIPISPPCFPQFLYKAPLDPRSQLLFLLSSPSE